MALMPYLFVYCVLGPWSVSAVVHGMRSRLASASTGDEGMDEGRANIVATQLSFNAASQTGETREEATIRGDIAEAMRSPSVLGKPVRSMPRSEQVLKCLPDLSACPEGWSRNGALCFASAGYSGPCISPVAIDALAAPEKMAYARQCKVSFPCQQDCEVDGGQPCPSLWTEIDSGVCQAPSNYVGECSKVVNISSFTSRDKQIFESRCGARWPCRPPSPRLYHDVCPLGWTLQFGQVCGAPPTYAGPCASVLQMRGATVPNKQQLEAACNVSWPSLSETCERDYGSCPVGWLEVGPQDAQECRAPFSYTQCGVVKSFVGVGPDEKRRWARLCGQTFPCRSRGACKKDWDVVCPAGWFAFKGGLSCLAPRSYAGACMSVLTGLDDLPVSEKERLQHVCGFSWPCLGEVQPSRVDVPVKVANMRSQLVDVAQYVSSNGPVSSLGLVG